MNRQATQEQSEDGARYGERKGSDEGQEEINGGGYSRCVRLGSKIREELASLYLHCVVAFCGAYGIESDSSYRKRIATCRKQK